MLAPDFVPVWGGVGTYIIELTRHLPKNFEVHIVTLKRREFGSNPWERVSIEDYDSFKFAGDNVHVHFISEANDTFFYNARFQYDCLRKVPKLVKAEKIDLIHSHMAHMPDLLLLFRNLSVPIVTTIHTTIGSQREGTKASKRDFWELDRSEKFTYLMYPILNLCEKIYLSKERHYITPSNWMKKRIENHLSIRNRIQVIYNSVDPNGYETSGIKNLEDDFRRKFESRRIVLYAGRLLAMKGLNTLIDAIPKALKAVQSREILFVFAGPGNPTPYVTMLKERDISPRNYIFTGPLPREMLISLMKIAELLVFPSFLENCPYTILESMACGIPVVASNVGGIPEIITPGYDGILVKPGSSERLSKAIVDLLEDRVLRSRMGQHAKETIRNDFSWAVNKKKYVSLYEQISG
jgi:glycosyltransferase involved in cell wall biosynthesis